VAERFLEKNVRLRLLQEEEEEEEESTTLTELELGVFELDEI
jgi:hypothetical protein